MLVSLRKQDCVCVWGRDGPATRSTNGEGKDRTGRRSSTRAGKLECHGKQSKKARKQAQEEEESPGMRRIPISQCWFILFFCVGVHATTPQAMHLRARACSALDRGTIWTYVCFFPLSAYHPIHLCLDRYVPSASVTAPAQCTHGAGPSQAFIDHHCLVPVNVAVGANKRGGAAVATGVAAANVPTVIGAHGVVARVAVHEPLQMLTAEVCVTHLARAHARGPTIHAKGAGGRAVWALSQKRLLIARVSSSSICDI